MRRRHERPALPLLDRAHDLRRRRRHHPRRRRRRAGREDDPLHRHQRHGAVALQREPRPPPRRVHGPRGGGARGPGDQGVARDRAALRAGSRQPQRQAAATVGRGPGRRPLAGPEPHGARAGAGPLAPERRGMGPQPRLRRARRGGRGGASQPVRPRRVRRRALTGRTARRRRELGRRRRRRARPQRRMGRHPQPRPGRRLARRLVAARFVAALQLPARPRLRLPVLRGGSGRRLPAPACRLRRERPRLPAAVLLVPEGLRVRERQREGRRGRRRIPVRPARQPARLDDLSLRDRLQRSADGPGRSSTCTRRRPSRSA